LLPQLHDGGLGRPRRQFWKEREATQGGQRKKKIRDWWKQKKLGKGIRVRRKTSRRKEVRRDLTEKEGASGRISSKEKSICPFQRRKCGEKKEGGEGG